MAEGRRRWSPKIVGLLLGFTLVPTASWSQAFSVPISDKVVRGKITMPGSQMPEIGFLVREGTMVTVRNEVTGLEAGWVAILQNGQPTLRPFEIKPYKGGERATQIGPDTLVTLGSTEDFNISGKIFRIETQDIKDGNFPNMQVLNPRGVNPDKLQKIFGKSGGGVCCVTCGSMTVCATAVDMDCGSCDATGRSAYVY